MRGKGIRVHVGFAIVGAFVLSAHAALAAATAGVDGARLAYVDPGSGSFILQALVATAAGAAVAINAYWGKIKGFLGLGTSESDEEAVDSQSRDD